MVVGRPHGESAPDSRGERGAPWPSVGGDPAQGDPGPLQAAPAGRLAPVRAFRALAARIPAEGFARHALAISSGVAVAQVISILATPIVTRLYAPSIYGTVATLGSLATIVALVASLRFEVAIPIARDDDEATSLTVLALACSTIISLIAVAALLVLPETMLGGIGLAEDAWSLRWVIPGLAFLGAVQTVVTQYGTYRRAYRPIAAASVLQASTSSGVKIGAGLIAPLPIGLIAGEIARRFLGIGTIATRSGLRARSLLRGASFGRLRATASAFRRYPVFVLPSSLLNTISLQAPVVILASHFSTVESGLYALGVGAVQVPLSLVESGVSNAFIGRIREYERSGRLAEVMTGMVQALALLSAPWFGFCAIWGSDLIEVAFGRPWREAGTYLALLAPWLFVAFVFSACGMVLWARNRQGADFGWQVLLVTGRVASLEIGSALVSAAGAVACFAAVSFVLLSGYNWWLLRLVGVSVVRSLGYALLELAWYLAMSAILRWSLVAAGLPAVVAFGVSACVVGAVAFRRLSTHPSLRFLFGR